MKLHFDKASDNPVDKFIWIPFGKTIVNLVGEDGSEAISMLQNNLGVMLDYFGDYEGARVLVEKSLAFYEKNFGKDHPETAILYSNLGLRLKNLGDYQGARTLLEKAMASDEKNFGKDHPSTAIRYSNLALVLQALGNYEGALELSAKSITIFRKALPAGHPNIKTVEEIYESIKEKLEGK